MPKISVTKNLGAKIRALRTERGVRSGDLAEKIKRSRSYITKLEQGAVADIDISLLKQILSYIVGDDVNEQNTAINNMLDNEIITLTDKEVEERVWKLNFDTVIRRITVSDNLIGYINSQLNQSGISVEQVVEKANLNEDLQYLFQDGEPMSKYPANQWFAHKSSDGSQGASIVISLDVNIINSILSGKQKSCPYYMLESFMYSYFKLAGMKSESARAMAVSTLTRYKFLSLFERSRIVDSARNSSEIEDQLPEEDILVHKYLRIIREQLSSVSQLNLAYAVQHLETFSKNLKEDPILSMAVIGIDITNLSSMSRDRKKRFKQDLEDLVKKYEGMPVLTEDMLV